MDGIVARSRARWYESGERSTSYFLRLEKRNYVNKLILALKIGTERITGQKDNIKILENHYREVFRERHVDEDEVGEYLS